MQIWAQKLVPQHFVSRMAGKLAHCRISWLKNFLIRIFIRHFKVDMSEAVHEDYRAYETFNHFFTRQLKPGLRPITNDERYVVSPVDGEVSEIGLIQDQQIFQAKGHYYDLKELLAGDEALASQFRNGAFMTAYLSPKDYHCVHMPISGRLTKMIHVPGSLFSVNHDTVKGVPNLFSRNERALCYFETSHGPMIVIMVAAIIVAGIATTWHGLITPPRQQKIQKWSYENQQIMLQRGEQMGHFEVGSTVIVLFAEGAVEWERSIKAGSSLLLGQAIAASN